MALCAHHGVLQPVLEQRAVGKLGERVVHRLVGHLHLERLALGRVGDRAPDRGAVDAALDEVVLRALLHRLDREQLVLKAAQDHDRHVGRGGPQLHQRLEAARVRQREVEQHAVGALGPSAAGARR